MLPQEQQQLRIDELTREIKARRRQIKQLQEERENAQKMQENAEDPSAAVGDSQKVVANINKWTCNPLLGVAFNYALTTGKRIMDKPIIPKSTKIKNQLTSFLHTLDVKLNGDSQNCQSIQSTVNPVETRSTETQTDEALCTIDKKVPQPIMPMKSGKDNNTINVVENDLNYQTVKTALAYLEDIKRTFRNKPEVYNTFLDHMKDFKAGNLSHIDVMEKVKVLFSGHPPLLVGFNTFLPPTHQIDPQALDVVPVLPIIASVDVNPKQVAKSVDEIVVNENHSVSKPVLTIPEASVKAENQTQKKPEDCYEARSYMTKLKKRFQNEPEKLKHFGTILQMFDKLLRDKACHDVKDYDGAVQVLVQLVGDLFKNDEDLLKEFTQYLE